MGTTGANRVLNYPTDYDTIKASTVVAQTDVLRAYLMERRRALLTELRSIDKVLGTDSLPAKVTR